MQARNIFGAKVLLNVCSKICVLFSYKQATLSSIQINKLVLYVSETERRVWFGVHNFKTFKWISYMGNQVFGLM